MTHTARSLEDMLARCRHDPLLFVMTAFDWEKGPLKGKRIEPWQYDVLMYIKEHISPHEALKIAIASGHGIGKSTLVAWIVLWALMTFPDTRGIVTANTENQLKTKTWVEVTKWYQMSCFKHLFRCDATGMSAIHHSEKRLWRIDCVPWSERNTEAFAGLHNQGGRILIIFDEASAIPQSVWDVTEGALTDKDTEILWCVFGNPTQNDGTFKHCFTTYKHRWFTRQIDSRSTSLSDKNQIEKWRHDYGEDSDFFRVRVRGLFPKQGFCQFISSGDVLQATQRELFEVRGDPLMLGVDVARFGDDHSVLFFRRGYDAKSIPFIMKKNLDLMSLSSFVSEQVEKYGVDYIFVDGGGVGGGVVDRLREFGYKVFDINFGGRSLDQRLADKGTEMWYKMREALCTNLVVPNHHELIRQLEERQYGFLPNGKIKLEKKSAMKARGGGSPDIADALALTYAYHVGFAGHLNDHQTMALSEFDPFET